MKSMFEYAGTMVIMLLVTFVFITFMSIEIQEVSARNYHTRVVETIQNDSNYEELSDYEDDNIKLQLNDDNTVLVTYKYQIDVPLFGGVFNEEIVGYAR